MRKPTPENTPAAGHARPRRSGDRRPLRKPDPERVPQGETAAEREAQKARRDVAEGADQDRVAEPEHRRADGMADRGERARPSIQP